MTKELFIAMDILDLLDNPTDAPCAHETVIGCLMKEHGMDMSDAHTVLCTADYLHTHGLTAVEA